MPSEEVVVARRPVPSLLARTTWIVVLFLPNLLLLDSGWQRATAVPFMASAWLLTTLAALLRPLALVAATLPFAIAAVFLWGADRLAHVDAIELAAVWYTFSRAEIQAAIAPYAAAAVAAAAAVVLLALWVARTPHASPRPAAIGALLACGMALPVFTERAEWMRSWPLNLVDAAVAMTQDRDGGASRATRSLRDPSASWQAKRAAPGSAEETYVLVIGESMRADRMNGCGGPGQVQAIDRDAILFCDMLAGSNNTHTSVPLLVSRDAPGGLQHALRDSTVLNAFEAADFETFWLGAQERVIAWPDARHQVYDAYGRLDRDFLLPALHRALARPGPRKALVLHATNAHFPYAEHYRAGIAPFKVDPALVETEIAQRRFAYDNAMDESVRFVNGVIETLRGRPGEAFMIMTADHGENLHDDGRALLLHALKRPTWWDARVPAVVWANERWKQAHPAAWKQLAANRASPLMHGDVVPTMLGAARIAYLDPRHDPVDLTRRRPPLNRVRVVQWGAARVMTEAQLRADARDAGPPSDPAPASIAD